MVDRNISISCVVAYLLWALALVVWTASWIASFASLGQLAIIISAAAATGTVRTYFVEQHQRMKAALAVTATVRESATVSPMR